MHLEQYEREGEAFLRRIITTDETWAKACEPKLVTPIKWRGSGSLRKVTSGWNQCEDRADRSLLLRWCNLNLYHPPYSPNISQCNYDLIPKMTAPLRGIRLHTVNDVLQATDRSLRNLQRLGTLNGNGFHITGDTCYTMVVITLKDCKHTTSVPKICIYIINSCNY